MQSAGIPCSCLPAGNGDTSAFASCKELSKYLGDELAAASYYGQHVIDAVAQILWSNEVRCLKGLCGLQGSHLKQLLHPILERGALAGDADLDSLVTSLDLFILTQNESGWFSSIPM